jgi:hypothetical protein
MISSRVAPDARVAARVRWMPFFPGEVVMVLDAEEEFRPQPSADGVVDAGVVGVGVAAHEFHRGPVLGARLRIEREPREPRLLRREFRMQGSSERRVVLADRGAGPATARVRQKRDVAAWLESPAETGAASVETFLADDELAELDEVIARARGAELGPRPIAGSGRDRTDRPVVVHDRMLPTEPAIKRRPDPEARFGLDRLDELVLVPLEIVRLHVKDRKPNPTGNVDADGVGNDAPFGRQHPTDRQPIADMRVRHERRPHRDRQPGGNAHLVDRFGLDLRRPPHPAGDAARHQIAGR